MTAHRPAAEGSHAITKTGGGFESLSHRGFDRLSRRGFSTAQGPKGVDNQESCK